MPAWLDKMVESLNGKQSVRGLLDELQQHRVPVMLEISSGKQSLMAVSFVQQVRSEDFIIDQPIIGGATHPLTFGENIRMGFVHNQNYHSGWTRCLGRIKLDSKGPARSNLTHSSKVIYAYRMTLPSALPSSERRKSPRGRMELGETVEAQLYAPASQSGPVLGHMADISMSGAKLVSGMPPRHLEPGMTVYLKAQLPDPAGLIDELVTVARIECDVRSGQCVIGVNFSRHLEGIERLLRTGLATAA